MRKLQDIHVSYGNFVIKRLPCSSIIQHSLTVSVESSSFQGIFDVLFRCTVKYWSCYMPAKFCCRPSKMNFKNLTDIHTGRYTQWVQTDLQWSSIRKERHIFFWQYSGDNILVTMTSRHLITYRDLSSLCDVAANQHVYSRWQLVFVFS